MKYILYSKSQKQLVYPYFHREANVAVDTRFRGPGKFATLTKWYSSDFLRNLNNNGSFHFLSGKYHSIVLPKEDLCFKSNNTFENIEWDKVVRAEREQDFRKYLNSHLKSEDWKNNKIRPDTHYFRVCVECENNDWFCCYNHVKFVKEIKNRKLGIKKMVHYGNPAFVIVDLRATKEAMTNLVLGMPEDIKIEIVETETGAELLERIGRYFAMKNKPLTDRPV